MLNPAHLQAIRAGLVIPAAPDGAMQRLQGRIAAQQAAKDLAWAESQVDDFPEAWAEKLKRRWCLPMDRVAANLQHLKASRAIRAAQHVGVPADAGDDQIRQEAASVARDTARRLDMAARTADQKLQDGTMKPEQRERLTLLGLLMEAMDWAERRQVLERFMVLAGRSIQAAMRRLRCEHFWRRVLRGVHARAVESTARVLGLVNKRHGCYVSNESLRRRRGQLARNASGLESVVAVNEHGQDYTLAELAAKGQANKEIRRMELMVRMAGFELIAKECGHEALFVTVSCPSRMHAWRTKRSGKGFKLYGVEPNPRHDGTQPDQAQRYLCDQWRKFSEACRRWGVELYGFRIAEPHHDGTPHWHALLFFPPVVGEGTLKRNPRRGRPVACRIVLKMLRQYFLRNDSATERGARRRRIKVERIDWAKGSAAGYVAKYVSKNIDGYKVEKDLYGNDTLTSSQRVDAWASTWRIRQFQQIGGAPVGVWRELRRLHPDQAAESATVALALDAVNKAGEAEKSEWEVAQRHTAAHGFATYLHLQGGHRVLRRNLRLHVLRESSGELGRYGELMPPRAVGVVTVENRVEHVPGFGIVKGFSRHRAVRAEVESERATWLVVPKGFVEQARMRLQGASAGGAAARPGSPVNNCTRPDRLFAPAVERHVKRGRWHRWENRGRGTQPKESSDGPDPNPRNHPGPGRGHHHQ